MKTRICLILLAACLCLFAGVQSPANLVYQNRGRFSEGIRTPLSTAPNLDLIAALVEYHEPYSQLPPSFRVLFYLPKQGPVFLTIGEIKDRYSYWLDKVQPESGWQAEKPNAFEWPTATVISSLTWRSGGRLSLEDLGAIVRLGSPTAAKVEQVAPVALYHSRPPQSVEVYCFIFRPSTRMRLRFEIFGEGTGAALESQVFTSVLANEPQRVKWDAREWPAGWYRQVATGYALSNNARVDASVSFYHVRQLKK